MNALHATDQEKKGQPWLDDGSHISEIDNCPTNRELITVVSVLVFEDNLTPRGGVDFDSSVSKLRVRLTGRKSRSYVHCPFLTVRRIKPE